MASQTEYTRKPYTGSCHCGLIKYIVYLTLPTSPPSSLIDLKSFREKSGLKIYKCNCTVCHKMGFFHLRLRSAPDDFLLLSPVTPDEEGSGVGAYTCNSELAKWYFCRRCGVRTFTIRGEKEVGEVEVPSKLLRKDGSGEGVEKVAVWRVKKEGWNEEHSDEGKSYFSLNMTTVDARQGLDLRRVQDWGVVEYCDSLFEEGDWAGVPYEGGMY